MDTATQTPEKKNLFGTLSLLGLLLSLFVLLMIAERGYNLFRSIEGKKPDNVFSVSAEGKVKATPDTAVVSLGVIAQGKDAKDAQTQSVDKINKITEFAKSLGIAKEDIATSQSSLNPRYDWTNGQSRIVGFDSNQVLTIKVRKVNENTEVVGKLLAGAVEKGANSVQGSQFVIDDPENLRQEARKIAISKAKDKAKELASEAGIKLGDVISISENGSYNPYPPIMYGRDAAVGMGGGTAESKAMPAPAIEVGTEEVVQNVTLTFEVK